MLELTRPAVPAPPHYTPRLQLDPTRLEKPEDQKKNLAHLISAVTAFVNAIFASADAMPSYVSLTNNALVALACTYHPTTLCACVSFPLSLFRSRGMARVFAGLRTAVKERFQTTDDDVVSYTVISGFLFLRLFVAATMTPVLFGLWPGARSSERSPCPRPRPQSWP